ncbi:MAG: stage III sporulation protein AC [Oscillospiraceae bacterium]|nr:stage III sporulation protein AC [Oscillospiraceae bacterium]
MDTDLIFRIAGIGLMVSLVNLILTKSGREDAAFLVTLAGLAVVLVSLVRELSELFALIRSAFSF